MSTRRILLLKETLHCSLLPPNITICIHDISFSSSSVMFYLSLFSLELETLTTFETFSCRILILNGKSTPFSFITKFSNMHTCNVVSF